MDACIAPLFIKAAFQHLGEKACKSASPNARFHAVFFTESIKFFVGEFLKVHKRGFIERILP